jgi:hypothetical protein
MPDYTRTRTDAERLRNDPAVLKLMFGALIRAAERWRGLRFTEFELRQNVVTRNSSTPTRLRSRRWLGHPSPPFQQIRALTYPHGQRLRRPKQGLKLRSMRRPFGDLGPHMCACEEVRMCGVLVR